MAVQVVCCELVSAYFSDYQGKYREFSCLPGRFISTHSAEAPAIWTPELLIETTRRRTKQGKIRESEWPITRHSLVIGFEEA